MRPLWQLLALMLCLPAQGAHSKDIESVGYDNSKIVGYYNPFVSRIKAAINNRPFTVDVIAGNSAAGYQQAELVEETLANDLRAKAKFMAQQEGVHVVVTGGTNDGIGLVHDVVRRLRAEGIKNIFVAGISMNKILEYERSYPGTISSEVNLLFSLNNVSSVPDPSVPWQNIEFKGGASRMVDILFDLGNLAKCRGARFFAVEGGMQTLHELTEFFLRGAKGPPRKNPWEIHLVLGAKPNEEFVKKGKFAGIFAGTLFLLWEQTTQAIEKFKGSQSMIQIHRRLLQSQGAESTEAARNAINAYNDFLLENRYNPMKNPAESLLTLVSELSRLEAIDKNSRTAEEHKQLSEVQTKLSFFRILSPSMRQRMLADLYKLTSNQEGDSSKNSRAVVARRSVQFLQEEAPIDSVVQRVFSWQLQTVPKGLRCASRFSL